MVTWADIVLCTDAGRMFPEAAAELVRKAGEGSEALPQLPPAPTLVEPSPAED